MRSGGVVLVAAACLAATWLSGCGFRHLARTVGEGRGELRASLGGPFLGALSGPLLVPSLRAGGRYGVTDGLDVDGSLALDPLVFGVLALDAGLVGQLYREPGGFALSLSGHAHFLFDLDDDLTTRGFPELGLHAEHRVDPWLTLFGGVVALAQFEPPDGKPPVFVAPYLGAELHLDRSAPTRHSFVIQLAWVSPWEDLGPSWASWEPDGYGAFALVLGWRSLHGPEEGPAR
ncbi:MAG: hypothetical protein KF729_26350 [Sandaracinaceae bacterium]|nr:hypothetical protein [Sandaracinaceae bacterium]